MSQPQVGWHRTGVAEVDVEAAAGPQRQCRRGLCYKGGSAAGIARPSRPQAELLQNAGRAVARVVVAAPSAMTRGRRSERSVDGAVYVFIANSNCDHLWTAVLAGFFSRLASIGTQWPIDDAPPWK